jgi:NAD(P)-dependent dehydrogenase (short-subunit alcohol dehydrogenase family)
MKGLVEGKVAVITGAGSGVGRAASILFAQHGAKIVAADVDLAAVEATAAEVIANGGEAVAVYCDVSDRASVDNAVATAVSTFGVLDIMYNNAGITLTPKPGEPLKAFVDADDADIARLQGVNVHGVMYGCQAALKQFEQQDQPGVIVNTASVAGLVGYGGVVYGASKGAITNLTRTLALEVAAQGIRVNSVCPAGMATNFMGKDFATDDRVKQSMGSAHPLGRAIEPLECANAALFLASDMASNITGVNLPVDGGLSAGVPMRRK